MVVEIASETCGADVADCLFEVVGGVSSGGIIVRDGCTNKSAEHDERLAVGSIIKSAKRENGRVEYTLVSGKGPTNGWVSLSASGRHLLAEVEEEIDVGSDASTATSPGEEAIQYYAHRLVEARKGCNEDSILFNNVEKSVRKVADAVDSASLCFELDQQIAGGHEVAKALARLTGPTENYNFKYAKHLCRHCKMPMGDTGYAMKRDRGEHMMHAECISQVVLQERQKEDAAKKTKELELKLERRQEYDIGWNIATIPSNVTSTTKLGLEIPVRGMCCVVLSADDNVFDVAPTVEPACAINLEYLSTSLQVRRSEGREPLFSLDPVEASSRLAADLPEGAMQKKRFEPEWLAGTTVGEVLFQADYHLKELSMGEHMQPVIGMKSCFDYLTADSDMSWSAREWFVVRKAEIHVSEDAVVVPYLKMGVEAREQLMGSNGLEDALLTRPNHPLVQYAEAFTRNFDLIAERKSVICQLREVAKASIAAKFLLESGIEIEDQWYNLSDQKGEACCLEVPQLWNDRSFAKIFVDGEDDSADGGLEQKADRTKVHSVYGGVDFGIDRFRLAAPSRIATSVVAGRAALGRPASTLMATSQAGLAVGPARQFSRLAAPLSARTTLTAPSRLAAPLSARAGLAAPLSAMAAARPATSLMATSRLSMGAPQARLAAPLRASMAAPSRLAAPLTARAGLAAPLSAMAAARPATSLMATSRLSMGAPQARLAAPLSAISAARPASSLMATSRISMAAPQVATARLSMGMPRGVDLNLDSFSLSAPPAGSWAGTLRAPAGAEDFVINSKDFISGLKSETNILFDEGDRTLLKQVFAEQLSDRIEEGDLFMPPPTGSTYMQRLRCLVKEETSVQTKRLDQFRSAEFSINDLGPLFPSSWACPVEFEGDMPQNGKLVAVSFDADAPDLQTLLKSTDPVFDRLAEDGTRFRVYRAGHLEVRTAQESSQQQEVVVAVCSAGAAE